MYEHITARVKSGKHIGQTIGFPTINLIASDLALPAATYKVNVIIDGKKHTGLGPFFAEKKIFEIHILNFSGDLYGHEVTIIPFTKIRDNKQFSTTKQLVAQIQKDIERAKKYVHKVITFGTFDYLHPGHQYYLTQASRYGDQLITIVAKDETVHKVKGFFPDHNENERAACLKKLHLTDIVELGDPLDYYTCLRNHQPNVICLGYDQHSFDEPLKVWCEKNLPDATIIRLAPFQPEKRKSSLMKKNSS